MGRIKAAFRPLLKRHHDEAIGLVVGEPLATHGCLLSEMRATRPSRRALVVRRL